MVKPSPAPGKRSVFGVGVSVTDYGHVVETVLAAASAGRAATFAFMPVHSLVTAMREPAFREALEGFDVVAPDGQPVRWALNRLHNAGLTDRVYGPETMLRTCRAAAAQGGVPIYLYGSSDATLGKLRERLTREFPSLVIAGSESPPYRELTDDETQAAIARIRDSGARIVFIGLGCPRQERFAARHREAIGLPVLCVGAAFDFLAGVKRTAPGWMQRSGMEWLFRLATEPRRLARRYAVTNTLFVLAAVRHGLLWRRGSSSPLPS